MPQFSKGARGQTLKFPLTKAALGKLEESDLASPRVGNAHGLELPERLKDLTRDSEAVLEVGEVGDQVARGEFPIEFMQRYYPESWGKFDGSRLPQPLRNEGLRIRKPQGLADVVHMDNPLDLGRAILGWLLSVGAKRKDVADSKHKPFVDMVPKTMSEMGVATYKGLDAAFDAKYYFGLERPEEVTGSNCTMYPEGCPTHPSFPAGHGAAAGAQAAYYIDTFELTEEQVKVIRDSAYCWAMFRTFAGVHYADDNLAGLQVGGLKL